MLMNLVPNHRKRDTIWNAMTEEEKQVYLKTTLDKGNKRYEFSIIHPGSSVTNFTQTGLPFCSLEGHLQRSSVDYYVSKI